jgi:hypothetical protein
MIVANASLTHKISATKHEIDILQNAMADNTAGQSGKNCDKVLV